MTFDELPDASRPVEQPAAPRPRSAAETLARALGTSSRPAAPPTPEEPVEVVAEHNPAQ